MTVLDALAYLGQHDLAALIFLFWHTCLLEVPRYTLGMLVVAGRELTARRPPPFVRPVSVLLPGHNEAAALRRTVLSIREQTLPVVQIVVVDDGSTDGMGRVAEELRAEGLVDVALSTRLRGGKSAAANLGLARCAHDIVVIADVDTTFDRDAFERLIRPFADPAVGAVGGNLGVRNWDSGLITRWQAVQYLISISLGRRVSDMLGILFIVSGAFGAFRRAALLQVGGWEVGPGEDADLTVKVRRAGWDVRFAPDAWALTDVPETLGRLTRQRLRWSRSLVRVRVRKFGVVFNPFQAQFSLADALGTADILFFQAFLAASFAVYAGGLLVEVGPSLTLMILAASAVVHMLLQLVSFLVASALSGHRGRPGLWVYALGFGLFNAYWLRFVQLWAYVEELALRRSYRDPYVPRKVLDRVRRF